MIKSQSYPFRVVFLHGLFGSQKEFLWYKQNVKGATDAFLYELPNHGKRTEEAPFSLRFLLSDLETQLKNAGIERPLFVGHSLGGKLALHYASKHLKEVAGVCMLDIFPCRTINMEQFQAELPALLQELQASSHPEATAAQWTSDYGRYLHKYLKLRGGIITPATCQAFIDFITKELHFLNRPSRFSKPLMFIQDSTLPFTEDIHIALLEILHPRQAVIPIADAGHMLHITRRQEVGKHIARFIKRCSK
jgi:UPI00017B23DD related cluster